MPNIVLLLAILVFLCVCVGGWVLLFAPLQFFLNAERLINKILGRIETKLGTKPQETSNSEGGLYEMKYLREFRDCMLKSSHLIDKEFAGNLDELIQLQGMSDEMMTDKELSNRLDELLLQYQKDKTETEIKEKQEQRREQQRERRRKQKEARLAQAEAELAWANRLKEVAAVHEDWAEVKAVADTIMMPQTHLDMVLQSDIGPEVVYFLGKNPELATRIADMPPEDAAMEIARIESDIIAASKFEQVAPARKVLWQ